MNSKELGTLGEKLVSEYIKNKGFKIVKSNYTCKIGELDIIGKRKGEIYFIEVKTRKNSYFGSPFESITLRKQLQIAKISRYFLQESGLLGVKCHFSAASVTFDDNGKPIIDFIEDAFQVVGA